MARILAEDDAVVVHLAWWEKVTAHHGDLRLPWAAVRRVTVEPDWWRTLRGVRQSGCSIPGTLSLGTRCHQAGKDFTAVRPGTPVVCVELRPPAPFLLLAVSEQDEQEAEAVVDRLGRAAPNIDTSTPCRQPLPVAGEEVEEGEEGD
ncbi:hypothetical protein ABZ865_05760 [Streptomyces sp. NPDC047085]|uniref:hypothetical protein n=1 Tax=Streptomyces sp. NPDC047085 TaxID=3155140 RepID=UPI0033D07302